MLISPMFNKPQANPSVGQCYYFHRYFESVQQLILVKLSGKASLQIA